MAINTKVTGADKTKAAIRRELGKLAKTPFVTVGIHQEEGDHPDSDITMAQLGATHEYGAEINHPGGTSYGYATERDAKEGKVRFLPTGTGFIQLGVTKPHQITIPARPWLNPGVASGNAEYLSIIQNGLEEGLDPGVIMDRVGVVAVGKVQKYMTNLRTPPNKPSTIKKKGSSNPLIDSGAMRQSVSYKVTGIKPNEGIS